MLVNTTRSATIVFRFIFDTLAKFLLKRHTRFAYVARIHPFGLHRTHGRFLSGFPAPLPNRSLQHRSCKVLGLDGTDATKRIPPFSARQQVRCVTCQVKEHYLSREEHTFLPQNGEIIPHPLDARQLAIARENQAGAQTVSLTPYHKGPQSHTQRKSTMPFAVLRKGGRLPSHARESCPDRIRILSQSDGEFAGLQQR